ncbi:MAG: iron-containing alcohol dehydrogenase [Elusimicrobia bacterium]|nr:iron-containing alcohol dehydrogenase [Elusimicrobiota bacterium]
MENFAYSNPVKILFGKSMINRIGKEASSFGKKALLVYGKSSIKSNGVYDQIVKSLQKASIEFEEHPGVKPNPIISHAREGVKKARETGCDLIIAAGGGSVIDEAKAIAAGIHYQGDLWDFFIGKAKINSALPLITVLTIPATGSEMNSGFVVTNEETKQKYSAGSFYSFPKVSILDPETGYSLPKEQTAYGASDAVAHLLEGYLTTCDEDSEITDNYVFAVFKTIISSCERIFKDPKDYNARASMMWAATLALNGQQALGYKNISFPNHAIEHSLSALYDMPHGLGLAIIIPAYMKHNISKISKRLAKLGGNVFKVSKDTETIKAYENWLRKDLNLKTKLSENSIPREDFSKIADNADGLIKLWGMGISKKETESILEKAF